MGGGGFLFSPLHPYLYLHNWLEDALSTYSLLHTVVTTVKHSLLVHSTWPSLARSFASYAEVGWTYWMWGFPNVTYHGPILGCLTALGSSIVGLLDCVGLIYSWAT